MMSTYTSSPQASNWRAYFIRHPGLARLCIIIFLLMVWEVGARLFVDPTFLSPPSRVIVGYGSLLETAGVLAALRITLFELTVAFIIAVAIGVSVGLTIGLSRFANRSIKPIILLVYGLPQITILPIFVLYFGIGPASKIAFGVTHGMFPIMITVAAGVQNIKPILLIGARSMGASRLQILRYVIFPYMIPSLFTGMRLAMTGVLIGVLLAELYVSASGIGYFTAVFTDNFQPTDLLGLISTLAIMAIAINELLRRAELRFSRWKAG